MDIFIYDKTFDGLLTLVFECFEIKRFPNKILDEFCYQSDLLADVHYVKTDHKKSERVWKGLIKKLPKPSCERLYTCFLSEEEGIEQLILEYIKLVFTLPYSIENNFKEDCVLKLKQINRKVSIDAMRLIQFVRFQKTKDDIYYASVQPDYDVIKLVAGHFKDRFADQKWVIFDTKREYGIYYNLKDISEVTIENSKINRITGRLGYEIKDEKQDMLEDSWEIYYDAINIKERKNLKQHLGYMPRRFWKYLPEKNSLFQNKTKGLY